MDDVQNCGSKMTIMFPFYFNSIVARNIDCLDSGRVFFSLDFNACEGLPLGSAWRGNY
jgi:hypothetical protein